MSANAQSVLDGNIGGDISAPVLPSKPHVRPFIWRVLWFPVKLFLGMAFCQGLVGSVLVVGWTYRLAQRSVLKFWWNRSGRRERGETLAEFLAQSPQTSRLEHWPNWCLANAEFPGATDAKHETRNTEHVVSPITHHASRITFHLFHSLWQNLQLGFRAILNTWVLTLPACLLWLFGWYDGWNNSFNKGYEQAPVGPVISIVGILLFISAMFYVPMAQARQAATGEWRAFYQFSLIWKIVRLRWLACAGLALLYVAFALPLNALKTAPMFWPTGKPPLEQLADSQALKKLDSYFFWSALLVLPAYVILRLIAARIYASGILRLIGTGALQTSALAENEREALERLDLLTVQPQPEHHRLVKMLAWAGTRLGRTITGAALFFIWFAFVAQIYIAEFFYYHAGRGWLNQPLVQLPWFHYVPARLKNPAGEIIAAILVLLVMLLIASVRRVFVTRTQRDLPQ